MEITVLILLLMINGNEEASASLRRFLSFYRENRELLTALTSDRPVREESEAHEKSRPEQVGDPAVLEAYLNRLSL